MSESRPAFGQTDVVYFRDEDASARLLEGAIGGLWEVVNQLTRFRRTKRENFRVTIFGSARLQPGSPPYEAVESKMWAELVEWGRRSMLQQGRELASAVDFSIPHCVSDVAETVALIRVKREEWLRAQAAQAE
jgi:hypothetical protein